MEIHGRRELWNFMDGILKPGVPSVVEGDFNCILSQDEKKGEKKFSFSHGPFEMKAFMNRNDLHYVGILGSNFTWCNKKSGSAWILERPDRGDDMEALNKKLLRVLKSLFFWSKAKHQKLEELKESLKVEIEELSKAKEFSCNLAQLNTSWRQRAKAKWMKEGDSNSTFFHAFTNGRRNGNSIKQLKNDDGELIEDLVIIRSSFYQFFCSKWKHRDCQLDNWPSNGNILKQEDCEILEAIFFVEEVEKVIGELSNNISLGVDGITYSFFKAYWKIIGLDVWKAIQLCFTSERFSNLVMECVTDPVFLVQINGVDLEGIRGRSGFRKGCPLSPYLFILCSQLLTNAFLSKGRNLGLIVAPMAPRISDLLFVDDILIFCNAKMENLKRLKKITIDCCRWTGQQVNVSKTSIIYSKNMGRRRRRVISNLMGFMEVKELNYLGNKITLRRLVATYFSKILEKVALKLDIWGKTFISSADRVIHIKSILQAIHVFYTSMSLVPLSILKKLDRMCREFLWNKSIGDRGLHYVAWKDLCKLETKGGHSIHLAVDTVEALKAKLIWNFFKKPDSMLSKSLSAKYGKNVWDDDRRLNSSSTWKLMLSGAKALRKIVRWSIKDGTSVNVMKDIWILDKCLDRWPTFIAMEIDNLSNMSSFISDREWIPEKLQEFFEDELVKVICKIEIELENHEDVLELLKNHSGKNISAMVGCVNVNGEENENMLIQDWNCIKKLNLNPRVSFFWWKLLTNAIPTTTFLMHRRLIGSNLCPRCCDIKEDGEHVDVKCLKLK
ncbi:hypothetical protein KFK09_003839 [Dendrobium nobile]|uniref:Uncharacterized protein n=1 Tax=Dendrobium nobile TaxID=94219 RepID=A0A8T3BYX7_DENNO|nr:hypothetical protein KFK09_003839 [Dendrobium nobile]